MKEKSVRAALLVLLTMLVCANACADYGAVIDAGESAKLHLRAQPSFEAESIGLYFTGTEVVCRADTADPAQEWVRVSICANTGYMYSAYLKTGKAAAKVIPAQPSGIITAKGGANLRHGPSIGDGIATTIRYAETVTILGETSGHWYLVEYRGSPGYIKAELVRMQSIRAEKSAALASVLLGERMFMHAFSGTAMTMDKLDACFALENAGAVPVRFASLNMDNDGDQEVVVCASVSGEDVGYLVLDVQGERICGYPFFLRGMLELKQDGSFSFSSGAADSGFGTVSFEGGELFEVEMARSRMDGADVVYQVRGESSSQQAFEEAMRAQIAKPDAVWYAFTQENIRTWLAE